MSDSIIIGSLVLDSSDLEASMVTSRKLIIDLENEQKKLKKDTDNLSNANEEQLKTFIANENKLKRLKAEYSANQKSAVSLVDAQKRLDDAIDKVNVTQDEAAESNRQLIQIRRTLNTTTDEGTDAINRINEAIARNEAVIQSANSATEKQKSNIGNYPTYVGKAIASFDSFKETIIGALGPLAALGDKIIKNRENIEEMGDQSEESADGVAGLGQASEGSAKGIMSMVKSSLVFLATPLGIALAAIAATIAILVGAFKLMTASMNSTEEGSQKLAKVTATINGIFKGFFNIVKPLGEYLGGVFIDTFNAVISTAEKAAASLSKALRMVGLASAADKIDKATASVKKSAQASLELSKAEDQLQTMQRKSGLIQLQYQTQAEKLRQQRDDDTKSIGQRIAANNNLGASLRKQANEELAIANQQMKVANLRIKYEGKNTEALDKQAEAAEKIAEIKERITSQESEQLSNLNGLRREAAAAEKERQDKIKAAAEKALQEYVKNTQNKIDILKLEAQAETLTADERMKNLIAVNKLQNEMAAKSLSGLSRKKQELANQQELSSGILDIINDQIKQASDAQKKSLSENKQITDERLKTETENINLSAEAQKKLLNGKLLSEKEYQIASQAIENARLSAISETTKAYDEAEKERKQAKQENDDAISEAQFQLRLENIRAQKETEAELNQMIRDEEYLKEIEDLETQLERKLISNEVFYAKLALADKKYSNDTKKNDKIIAEQKEKNNVQMLNDGLSALNALFDGNKAVAVAMALVNTYQGISAGVKLGYPAAIPAVAAAAATGFAAVKNILKSNKNSSSGDAGSGAQTTSGTANFQTTSAVGLGGVAKASERPSTDNVVVSPPVLVVESLMEVIKGVEIKENSGG